MFKLFSKKASLVCFFCLFFLFPCFGASEPSYSRLEKKDSDSSNSDDDDLIEVENMKGGHSFSISKKDMLGGPRRMKQINKKPERQKQKIKPKKEKKGFRGNDSIQNKRDSLVVEQNLNDLKEFSEAAVEKKERV